MKQIEQSAWQLPPGHDPQPLLELLSQDYSIDKRTARPLSVTLLDDADHAVWQAGGLLFRQGKSSWLLHLAGEEYRLNRIPAGARFWWDLPESALQQQLRRIIDLRAVTAVADFAIERMDLSLRNEDEKIVIRAVLTRIMPQASENPCSYLQFKPLRGYHREYGKLLKQLQSYLLKPLQQASLQAMLRDCGELPENASGTKNFGISPDETVEQAVRQMALKMLATARDNEQGVVDDIDTEFLHQYRVSLRKTRSLINLMKNAFPADMQLQLKQALAELAGKTNWLRDMDVFLLERDRYREMLPESFSDGFDKLFSLIARDREKARKQVHESFLLRGHNDSFERVISLLSTAPLYATDFASRPVQQTASLLIIKRYRKIVRLGAAIDAGTPDAEVHALRIECKKLRYLMEFFAELYPAKSIGVLIKALKKLQTILGDFNDYSVQKEFLADYGKKHHRSVELAAAINGLIGVLHHKQVHARSLVQQAFADFSQEQNRARFTELFPTQEKSV